MVVQVRIQILLQLSHHLLDNHSRWEIWSWSFFILMVQMSRTRYFVLSNFFYYYQTPDIERLIIASIHMDKEVVPWFQMMQCTNPFNSWQVLTWALEMEFGPSMFDCPRASLFNLFQFGSVNTYYLEFMSLANRVDGLSPKAILGCFISGLQLDICREVTNKTPPFFFMLWP